MGRAQGAAQQTTSPGARFDQALGARRGLHGLADERRDAREKNVEQLLSDLRDPAPARVRAAADELALRLRCTPFTEQNPVSRRLLWAACYGALDVPVAQALLGGLCDGLASGGDAREIENAVGYLAWADLHERPASERVLGAVLARIADDRWLARSPEHSWPLDVLAAYRERTESREAPHLAALLAALAASRGGSFRDDVLDLLRSDPELARQGPLARAYVPGSECSESEEQMLLALAGAQERVAPDSPFAALIERWSRTPGLSRAAWKAMALRWEASDDGYEPLREMVREQLHASANIFSSHAGLALAARVDGQPSALAREVIAAAAAAPEQINTRYALAGELWQLPDAWRDAPDVCSLIFAFGKQTEALVAEKALKALSWLISSKHSHRGEVVLRRRLETYRDDVAQLARSAGAAYARALAAGQEPNRAAVQEVREDACALLARVASSERALKGIAFRTELQKRRGELGLRGGLRFDRLLCDESALRAAYRQQLAQAEDELLPEALFDRYHDSAILRALAAQLDDTLPAGEDEQRLELW